MKESNPEFYIKHLDIIDSTNSYARCESVALWEEAAPCEIVVVTANEQTAGRGQRGNVWASDAKMNLLATIMVRPQGLKVASQFALSQLAALAVRAAMSYYGIEVELKWPNDIYVGTRKLAGILVEVDCCSAVVDQAVIGIGLNVNQESYTPMEKQPVSMKMLLGESFDINDVLVSLLNAFSYYYHLLQKGEYSFLASDYKRNLMGYGQALNYRSAEGVFEAVIVDVCDSGHLCLQRSCGKQEIYAFKEVELIL